MEDPEIGSKRKKRAEDAHPTVASKRPRTEAQKSTPSAKEPPISVDI